MMFEQLEQSNQNGEFAGWMCRWHLRKDRQITIYEIIVEKRLQGQGIGRRIIEMLLRKSPACIVANCPADLPANGFYEHMGFSIEETWSTKSGRMMNKWILRL